ncbi:MAG: type III pantothenate kinase [Candidatus Metalachnospira sp.]|nr:type III pantothenate kinase [Candidatus Metalachnospira sp.]
MILVLDIGNSNIVVSGLEGESVVFSGRMKTDKNESTEDIAAHIDFILKLNNIDAVSVEGAIFSSVVPCINDKAESAIEKLTGKKPLIAGKTADYGLNILMDNPQRVGEDMLVDTVAALNQYEPPMLIFDLGTASTCSVIDKDGSYVASIIAPGAAISLKALSENTAKLPKIKLEAPKSILAKNTEESMKSGVIYGNAAMIDGLSERVFKELGYRAKIIATGGIACLIVPYCNNEIIYEPDLLTKGLGILWEKNKKNV